METKSQSKDEFSSAQAQKDIFKGIFYCLLVVLLVRSFVVEPFRIPSWWQRIVSIDPANTGITAALWIAVDEVGNHFAYREYYEHTEYEQVSGESK